MLINIKTEFNFLGSTCRIDDIINYALEHKLTEIGICDDCSTMASYEFISKCVKNNIKPIVGSAVELKGQTYLLYPKNLEGFKRLNQIISLLNNNVEVTLEIEHDLIVVLGQGLIADKIIKDASIKSLLTSFEAHFLKEDIYFGYMSYMNDPKNYELYNKLKAANVKTLIIDQISFFDKNQIQAYLSLKAVKYGKTIKQINTISQKYKRHTVHAFDESLFKDDYVDFNNKIDLKLAKKEYKILKYPFSKTGYDSDSYLTLLATSGLQKRRNFKVTKVYTDRLEFELSVIQKMGFSDYFLIVWDVVKFAKNNNIIVGPGRGSAAGSLVSYCLGITQVDPVENGLLFERFLNPMRLSMPDIDIDFEDVKRDLVVNYMVKRFTAVAKIATLSKFLAKSAFRDLAKVYELDVKYSDFISKLINSRISMIENIKTNKKLQGEYLKNKDFNFICDLIFQIEGLPRQTSVHAAGIIVCDTDLNYYGALLPDNVIAMQARDLEAQGLLKIDILALANLTFIASVLEKIKVSKSIDLNLNQISLKDQKTYQLLSSAQTNGIFQLESEGVKKVLLKVQPETFEDLTAVTSLYRPGPMQYIDLFVSNKRNFKVYNQVDELLRSTRGVIIYQEQIMMISQMIASYNLGEADILRRAISKKDVAAIKDIEIEFVNRGIKNGYEREFVEKIIGDIMTFAGYGFNKAHAYAYGVVIYQMAYLKAHFPLEFMAHLLQMNYYNEKREYFIQELTFSNIKLLVPDILTAELTISVFKKYLCLGFMNIKTMNKDIANQIINNRQDLTGEEDFITTIITVFKGIEISPTLINTLVDAGCFDRFKLNRPTLKANIKNYLQSDLLSILKFSTSNVSVIQKPDVDIVENARLEKAAILINLKFNIFENQKKLLEAKYKTRLITLDEACFLARTNNKIESYFTIMAQINFVKEIMTKKGEKMGFLTVKSIATQEITVFPSKYRLFSQDIDLSISKVVLMQVSIKEQNIYLENLKT